jgi:hypothetical protein
MSASALHEAVSVLVARLEAMGISDEEMIDTPPSMMALAFVGLDVDAAELIDIANDAIDPYAESVIVAATTAWHRLMEGESSEEVLAAGAEYGRRVCGNMLGVFCVGVLLGELHRSRTLERQATSD